MDVDEALRWAAIKPSDHAEVSSLLQRDPNDQVHAALAVLRNRWTEFHAAVPTSGIDELSWLAGLLRFIPKQLQGYRQRGIPDAIAAATLADIGRHLAISRTANGRFGLETWKWLTEQASGRLFQLGRLQFQLIPGPEGLPGVNAAEAVLGVHIPEAGPLSPDAVQDSFEQATEFFRKYFPERPVRFAHCHSWLLDPYLLQHLPETSNISAFASRFTLYGDLFDSPEDAVYFTFRSRDLSRLSGLPRKSSLQRVVLERIDAGGSWQTAQGYLRLSELNSLG